MYTYDTDIISNTVTYTYIYLVRAFYFKFECIRRSDNIVT